MAHTNLYKLVVLLMLLLVSCSQQQITSVNDLTHKDYYNMLVKYKQVRLPVNPDTIYAIKFERSLGGGDSYDYKEGRNLIHSFKNVLEIKFTKPKRGNAFKQKVLDSIDFTQLPNLKRITGILNYTQQQINQIAQSTSIEELEIHSTSPVLDSIPECICKNKNLRKLSIFVVKKIPECIKDMNIRSLYFYPTTKRRGGRSTRLHISLNKIINKLKKDTTKLDYSDRETMYGDLYPLEIKSLDSLVFETSRGDSLPPNIKALKNLRYLKIDGEMRSLPKEINELTNLEVLEIEGVTKGIDNPVCHMPKNFKGLQNLKVFSMNDYVVDRFPPLYDIPGLEHILITKVVGIDSIPDAIENLKNLQSFGYSEDGYKGFTDEQGWKVYKSLEQHLSEMDLEELIDKLNYQDGFYKPYFIYTGRTPLPYITTCATLSYLSPNIGKLSKLNFFSLSNVKLTSLPESIGELTNLKNFSVTNSYLKSLPQSIGNLNPAILNLENNQLTTLPNVTPIGKFGHAKLRKNKLSPAESDKFISSAKYTKENCDYCGSSDREALKEIRKADENYLEYKLFGRNKKFVKLHNLE